MAKRTNRVAAGLGWALPIENWAASCMDGSPCAVDHKQWEADEDDEG